MMHVSERERALFIEKNFFKGNPEKKIQRQTEYKRSIFFISDKIS